MKLRNGIFGLTLTSALALAAFSANAADMYRAAPAGGYKDEPVYVANTWTGFYAGVNGGYGWTPSDSKYGTDFSPSGGFGGGQIGYNWQVDRKWVLGLEGDIQWSGERSSSLLTVVGPRYGSTAIGIPFPGPGPDFNAIITQIANLAYDLQWFATFRGRAGVLVDPQTLLYATGGRRVQV